MSVENFEKEAAAKAKADAAAATKAAKEAAKQGTLLPPLEGTPEEQSIVPEHPISQGAQGAADDLNMEALENDEVLDKLFDTVEGKKANQGQELTSDYLDLNTFQDHEERNYIFTGMTTFTKPDTGEVIPAVNLLSKERKNYICASTLIVQSLRKVEKLPCAVRIQVNGKKKGQKGSYFDVRVFVF